MIQYYNFQMGAKHQLKNEQVEAKAKRRGMTLQQEVEGQSNLERQSKFIDWRKKNPGRPTKEFNGSFVSPFGINQTLFSDSTHFGFNRAPVLHLGNVVHLFDAGLDAAASKFKSALNKSDSLRGREGTNKIAPKNLESRRGETPAPRTRVQKIDQMAAKKGISRDQLVENKRKLAMLG